MSRTLFDLLGETFGIQFVQSVAHGNITGETGWQQSETSLGADTPIKAKHQILDDVHVHAVM